MKIIILCIHVAAIKPDTQHRHTIFFIFFCNRQLIDNLFNFSIQQAKLETKALKAKRPGFTDERYHETSYYIENGMFFTFLSRQISVLLILIASRANGKQFHPPIAPRIRCCVLSS